MPKKMIFFYFFLAFLIFTHYLCTSNTPERVLQWFFGIHFYKLSKSHKDKARKAFIFVFVIDKARKAFIYCFYIVK